jgi:energy-coupling factor transporter ATP-binding protein EcfA2
MSTSKAFQATKTRSNRPGWSVIFRHPKRTDSRGRAGLKVRRGLGTTDEAEADRLVAELNEMLADQRWWSVDRKKDATLQFDGRVVAIFFDGMEAGKVTSIELREARKPLPTAADGYSRVMFTGTTGAGKTTLLRHIIGTDHSKDRFPSTSTARTTTAEIEVIVEDGPFEAVVTFMPEHEVRAHIDECLEDACLSAVQEQPESKVASALLTHREQRFRLSYLLGAWAPDEPSDSDFLFESDEPEDDDMTDAEAVSQEEAVSNRERLTEYISRIQALAADVAAVVEGDFGTLQAQEGPEDRASWLELFGDALYEHEDFGRLALDILEEVESRFGRVSSGAFEKSATDWPVVWTFRSEDRDDFLRQVRWFSSNHHRQFGRLLTPLVDGVRVCGPFLPALPHLKVSPKLVLLDGEGIGHSAKSASSISTRVTRRFPNADLILIVDNAEQPMQSAPLELLRAIGNSGHGDKLAVAFTHFDQVKGGNFGSFEQKREHVMNSVRDAIGSLRQAIGSPVAAMLERRTESHSYFLGGLDRETGEIPKGFQNQLRELLVTMQASSQQPEPVEVAPIYSIEGLEIALRDAVEGFQEPWKARLGLKYHDGIAKEHWGRLKALARRFANAWANEYDTLRPVADLVARLQENISKWLDSPAGWTGAPLNDEQRDMALGAIRKAVFAALHDLVETRLADAHRPDWSKAFDYSGSGSSYRRAEDIDRIYEEAAPVINAAMTNPARAFLHELHTLVRNAVELSGGRFKIPAADLPIK